MKHISLLLITLFISLGSYATVGPITGWPGTCIGHPTLLFDTTTGGIWSSSNTSVATVDTSGLVTGVSAGTAIITYAVGADYATTTVTVTPVPLPIISDGVICYGDTITLVDSTPGGGNWHGDGSAAVTFFSPFVGTNSVRICANHPGYSMVYFQNPISLCQAGINIASEGPITGVSILNVDSTMMLHIIPAAGIWYSSDTFIASIDSVTGCVKGKAPGTVTISHHFGSCTETFTLTVSWPASVPVISGQNESGITIYPNPASKQLTITATCKLTSVSIIDLLGQTIFSDVFNSQQVQIDVADLPAGVYFVRINDAEVRKFVKQ